MAAVFKATRFVELKKDPNVMDGDCSRIKDFSRKLGRATKDGMKKAVVGGIVNATWIAKIVGKVTKRLESVQGDIGYSGNMPVALDTYRAEKGRASTVKVVAIEQGWLEAQGFLLWPFCL